MPSVLPIGSNLGIYAALAEIPPRPDGGFPKPTPFASRVSLALPRWLQSVSLDENLPSPPPANIVYPEARACNLYYPPDLTAEITIPAE